MPLEALQHAEAEGRGTDATAGEGQTDEPQGLGLVVCGCAEPAELLLLGIGVGALAAGYDLVPLGRDRWSLPSRRCGTDEGVRPEASKVQLSTTVASRGIEASPCGKDREHLSEGGELIAEAPQLTAEAPPFVLAVQVTSELPAVPVAGEGPHNRLEDRRRERREGGGTSAVLDHQFPRPQEELVQAVQRSRFVSVSVGEEIDGDARRKLGVELPGRQAILLGRR